MRMMDLAVYGSVCLTSVSGKNTDLKYGGSARDEGILEADVNENDIWDIW